MMRSTIKSQFLFEIQIGGFFCCPVLRALIDVIFLNVFKDTKLKKMTHHRTAPRQKNTESSTHREKGHSGPMYHFSEFETIYFVFEVTPKKHDIEFFQSLDLRYRYGYD